MSLIHLLDPEDEVARFEYLYYFEMNPDIVIEGEQTLRVIIWNGKDKINEIQ